MPFEADFLDNKEYGCSDLNSLRRTIIESGVMPGVGGDCKVTLSGTNAVIATGEAQLSNGVYVRITEPHPVPVGTGKHIILCHDSSSNEVKAEAVEKLPTEPSKCYLELAQISGTTVTDKRKICTLKVRAIANAYADSISVKYTLRKSELPKIPSGWTKFAEYECTMSHDYFHVSGANVTDHLRGSEIDKFDYLVFGVPVNTVFRHGDIGELMIKMNGNKLEVYYNATRGSMSAVAEIDFHILAI